MSFLWCFIVFSFLAPPPQVPNWETSITLSPNTHFMPEYPRPWLLSPGIAIHLCALPLLISPTTHPLLSTSLFQHPPPHAASPSRAIASLPGSICHPRLLRAAADTVKEKKKKTGKNPQWQYAKMRKGRCGLPWQRLWGYFQALMEINVMCQAGRHLRPQEN